jgi:hypothetical protein
MRRFGRNTNGFLLGAFNFSLLFIFLFHPIAALLGIFVEPTKYL